MIDKIVSAIGAFSYRRRKVIAALACVLLVCVAIVQSFAQIEYSYVEDSIVNELFPQDDTVVIVYDNDDEDKIAEIIAYLQKDEHVTSVNAYANTLGMEISVANAVELMGIDEMFVNMLFYMYENGTTVQGMKLVDFVGFITADSFLNNEMFSSMIDEGSRAQIGQLKSLVNALASKEKYSAEEIAEILTVDKVLVQSVFYIEQLRNMTLQTAPQTLMATLADLLGMEADKIEALFDVEPVKAMRFTDFVDLLSKLAGYAKGVLDENQLSQLEMLTDMSEMVQKKTLLYPEDVAELFSLAGESEMLTAENIQLLYIMAQSNVTDMSKVKIPVYDLFMFLSESILGDEMFASFLDESMVAQFDDAKVMMEEGLAQLISKNHSRMVITLDYPLESKGINNFYVNFTEMLDNTMDKEYYLVGSSAMSYEVSLSFQKEFLMISVVTAIAVFLVVLFTFRKLSIALLLIAVIECAVFSMMSVMVIIGTPMFFIALILVQCILMGSMIDYGILFTTYYMEVRKEYSVETALPEVMRRATHAILTSSLMIVIVTLICGMFMSGAVATILTTLGIGALCAILLILFVLPSLLSVFDNVIMDVKVKKEEKDPFDD